MKDRLILAAKLVLAAAVLYWLFQSGALELSKLSQLREKWAWFLLANLPYCLSQIIATIRWRLLLRIGSIDYSFGAVMELTLVGLFFNQMIFGSTGGDVVRGYAVAVDHPERRSAAVMSVMVDRVLGLVVLLVMTLVAAAVRSELLFEHPDLALLVGLVAGVLVGTFVVMWAYFSPWVQRHPMIRSVVARLPARDLLVRLSEAFKIYGRRPRDMWLASLQSLLLHVGIVAMNLCLVMILVDGPFDWVAILLLVPLAHVAMTIPINPPGAIGTAEAIYAYLFGLIGIGQGSLICILQRLILYLWALPGALIWVLRRKRAAPSAATQGT